MTPGARVQAAIEVLDRVLGSEASAERELLAWARGSRFAGSKDRAAVRDHVFDALRRLRSSAWVAGQGDVAPEAMAAPGVMAGLLAGRGLDPATLFTGEGYAPEPITLPKVAEPPRAVALDVPDWLLPRFSASLGDRTEAVLDAMRDRAPINLRVNLARADRYVVQAALAEAGVTAEEIPDFPTALRVAGAPRGLSRLAVFEDGICELQDAGAQGLVDRLPLLPGERVLDLCAGGGGKTLAMAGRGAGPLFVHDAAPERMRDLPVRAERAGVVVTPVEDPEAEAPFDGVVVDVPCSGSGSWRRTPEAKWRLTPERLSELIATQDAILARAARLVCPGGWIGYMTCSVLDEENGDLVEAACAAIGGLAVETTWSTAPDKGTDGFYLSVLRRG
ncbi:Ribosomal RNA small subunit methyltransferase B [Jannaschia seosinensis]|uniref:Ribosomal RNA small subunit methyltransferase B n=1 Tax=Jannaschia seosinensis TaxID=313367 RepID=A0A0M7B7J6_9RHOB|nr:RsmB/NOP family class I SAM-dependent RNA methyltransferase [Jannaschia seosinensis]CUH30750.1 Ribosomal RNA small subunit methyltransferase B [Jannaschia seosinensis]